MEYHAPNYGVKPPVATSTFAANKGIIICIAIAIVTSLLLIVVLALGLGLGLGLGLRKPHSPSSSTLSTCDATTATCGCPTVQSTISSRIVNANVATSNSWPWMVAIYISNGKLCGGTLISYQHVLTAAHCVFDVTTSDVVLYAGIQKLSERFNGQVRNVSIITVHPNYNDSIKANDLAILKLSSPLSASTTISLCCLSTTSSIPEIGSFATFIGWGRTTPTSGFSDDLRQATTRIVNPSLCSYAPITDNQICTGNTTSVACYGESGSPLMMKVNNAWTCVGVVNMGLLTCDSYVVFTRVSHYNSFISNTISM